ncbi:DNA-binding protein [Salmonella enterica subsp. diarizonae]|nr:DNA-binding protein [Salmonella enterica subsp. diarizonae]
MMGSRSISDLTGKDHSSVVVRDIKNLLKQLSIYPATPQDHDNKSFFFKMKTYNSREVIDEIFLNQDLSTTLVTGYSVQDRYKIIKRWGDLESGKAQPLIAAQPTSPTEPVANHDILSLARTVAEATASATMKAVLEVTRFNQVAASVASTPVRAQISSHAGFVSDDAEFVQVHKVSLATTMSDTSCRKLIKFANLPTRKFKGSHGLLVHRESFMLALRALIEESEPPTATRKRWQHPEFRGFSLRKDPQEIFGEAA